MILAGSLPPGWPEDTYQRLARQVRSCGGQIALDSSGPALAAGLGAAPEIVKPNLAELRELTGQGLADLDSVVAAGRALLAGPRGPGTVVVSMGAEGALFLAPREALLARAPRLAGTSTVGAGDAMVAGLVAARIAGLDLAGCARLATGFSAAKLARPGAHLPAPAEVRALAATVELGKIYQI